MSGNLQLRTRKFYKWNLVFQKHLTGRFNWRGSGCPPIPFKPDGVSSILYSAIEMSLVFLSASPKVSPVWPAVEVDIRIIADWLPGFLWGIHCLHSLCPTISLPILGCIVHDWASTKFLIWGLASGQPDRLFITIQAVKWRKESNRYKEGPLEKLKLDVMEGGTGFKGGGWETKKFSQ